MLLRKTKTTLNINSITALEVVLSYFCGGVLADYCTVNGLRASTGLYIGTDVLFLALGLLNHMLLEKKNISHCNENYITLLLFVTTQNVSLEQQQQNTILKFHLSFIFI